MPERGHKNLTFVDEGRMASNHTYFDVQELASYIKRSPGAIRNLVLRRAIPYRKPAGRLIFLKEEIDRWIQMAPGKKLEETQNDQWDNESFKSSIKRNGSHLPESRQGRPGWVLRG